MIRPVTQAPYRQMQEEGHQALPTARQGEPWDYSMNPPPPPYHAAL